MADDLREGRRAARHPAAGLRGHPPRRDRHGRGHLWRAAARAGGRLLPVRLGRQRVPAGRGPPHAQRPGHVRRLPKLGPEQLAPAPRRVVRPARDEAGGAEGLRAAPSAVLDGPCSGGEGRDGRGRDGLHGDPLGRRDRERRQQADEPLRAQLRPRRRPFPRERGPRQVPARAGALAGEDHHRGHHRGRLPSRRRRAMGPRRDAGRCGRAAGLGGRAGARAG